MIICTRFLFYLVALVGEHMPNQGMFLKNYVHGPDHFFSSCSRRLGSISVVCMQTRLFFLIGRKKPLWGGLHHGRLVCIYRSTQSGFRNRIISGLPNNSVLLNNSLLGRNFWIVHSLPVFLYLLFLFFFDGKGRSTAVH